MSRPVAYAYLAGLALLCVALSTSFSLAPDVQSSTEPIRVRWLLAHEPADVYARAIDVFTAELARESAGMMTLETITPSELGIERPNQASIHDALARGDAEISSTFGVANGFDDSRFWVWQMPFLFSGYDSVNAAFDSAEGDGLLASLSDHSPVHALAYTLSGGFRVLASAKEIASTDDLRGLRIATAGGPVAESLWRSVGAVPVATGSEDGPTDLAGIDAIETTYARLASVAGGSGEFTRAIAETNHSLFLTVIVAGDAFYDSLTSDQQRALVKAARAAAAAEREDAIALNAATKENLIAGGTVITVFSPNEEAAFKAAAASVYEELGAIVDPSVLAVFRSL